MRSLAVLAIVLGCGAATGGAAQSLSPQASAAVLAQAAFASGSDLGGDDAIGRLLDQQTIERGQGPSSWSVSEVRLPGAGGSTSAFDTLRFGAVRPLVSPSGLPLAPGQSAQLAQNQAYEISLVRNWPSAFAIETRSFGLDFSPHAGLGVTSYGGVAEAGGRLELRQKRGEMAGERLRALGVRDGASFGDRGRWYLFAAASGRAVGLNMLRSDTGWDRAGWTTDPTSTLVGDAQVGVGWRKGAMQTSLGFVHQQMKNDHLIFGQDSKADSMVAFSFAIRPQGR